MGGIVVHHLVQPPRIGLRDLAEEAQELLMAVPGLARLLEPAGSGLDLERSPLRATEEGAAVVISSQSRAAAKARSRTTSASMSHICATVRAAQACCAGREPGHSQQPWAA